MRVAQIVPSLEDRHGGPSKSVRALANALASRGTPTDLLTTLERGENMVARNDIAQLHVFPRKFPHRLCRSPELRAHLAANEYDIVHHHALWLLTLRYAQDAAKRLGAPLVISPRGMMSGWAYEHHRARKRLAEIAVHPGAFAATAGWHATSADEADAIRRLGFAQPICVAPNGVEPPSDAALAHARAAWQRICPAVASRRVALFYSRFHRKKRVRELLELWAQRPRGDWLLLLVGVPEDYSAAEIQSWIDAHGLREHAAVYDGRDQPAPFAAAELFLLPSHSENFGLVVAEALASTVPALVTDTTPWRELETHDAGWCVPWSEFSRELERALANDASSLRTRGERGRAWVSREFSWQGAAALLNDFYRTLRHE